MIDEDLIAYLRAGGTTAGDRVFLGSAHAGAQRPYVILLRSGGAQPKTLGGTNLFARTEMEVHIVADTYDQALPLANVLLGLLNGFRGQMGNTVVRSCSCTQYPTDAQAEPDGSRVVRWVQMRFLFVH